jgi:hypothetical protein
MESIVTSGIVARILGKTPNYLLRLLEWRADDLLFLLDCGKKL